MVPFDKRHPEKEENPQLLGVQGRNFNISV